MTSDCKYDIQGFSKDLGLPLPDIANLYAEFIREIHSEVSQLKELIPTRDWNTIKKIIHNIKGISVNFRIIDIHEKAETIHDALKTGSYNNIEPVFSDLFAICDAASEEIKKYFEQKGVALS